MGDEIEYKIWNNESQAITELAYFSGAKTSKDIARELETKEDWQEDIDKNWGKVIRIANKLEKNTEFSKVQIAGILGSLNKESRFDSFAESKSGSKDFWLAQWIGARKKNLIKYAKEKWVSSNNFDMQVDFLISELNDDNEWGAKWVGRWKSARQRFLNSNNIVDATNNYTNLFERPKAKDHPERIKFAKYIYGQMNKGVILADNTTKKVENKAESMKFIEPTKVLVDKTDFPRIRESKDGQFDIYTYEVKSGWTPWAVKNRFVEVYPKFKPHYDTIQITNWKAIEFAQSYQFKKWDEVFLRVPKKT